MAHRHKWETYDTDWCNEGNHFPAGSGVATLGALRWCKMHGDQNHTLWVARVRECTCGQVEKHDPASDDWNEVAV